MAYGNFPSGSGVAYSPFRGSGSGIKVAKATFDPSANTGERTVAAHNLPCVIPNGAIIIGGLVQVVTTFKSADDSGTIAIHVQSANDLVTATAISAGGNIWDAGNHDIVPDSTGSTAITLTADRTVTATVGTQALTAGKANIFLFYIEADD